MFFNKIFANNKTLSKVWQASFNCENNSDCGTDFTGVCNDLNQLVASDAVNYEKRLSLRSSTILIDGATKLLRSKTNQLADDMFKLNTEIVTRKRKLSKIDEEVSSDLIETPEKIMRATSDLHDITPPQNQTSQLKSIFSPKIAYSHSYCTDDNDFDNQKDSSNIGDVPDELNIAVDSIEELDTEESYSSEEDEEELIQMDLTEDIEEELQSTEINTEQSLVDELDNEASSTNEEEEESNEELEDESNETLEEESNEELEEESNDELEEESNKELEEEITEESLPTTEKIPSQNDNSSKTSRQTQSAERQDNSSNKESGKEKTQSIEANRELLTEDSLPSTVKIQSQNDNSSTQNSDVETEVQSTEFEELITEGITEQSLPSTEKIQSQNDNSSTNNSLVEEIQRKEINEETSLDKRIQKDKDQRKNDTKEESSNNSSVQENQEATNNIEQNETEERHKERRLEIQFTEVDSEELQSQRTTNYSKGKSIADISVPKSQSNEILLSKTPRTFKLKKKKSVQKKDQSCQTTDHGVSFTHSMRDRDSNIENLPKGYLLIHDTHNSRLPHKLIIASLNPNVRFI